MKGSTDAHTRLVNEILVAIGCLGFVRVWKNNTGRAEFEDEFGDRRRVAFGLPGSSDILGVLRRRDGAGIILCIECKTGQAVQSEKQKSFEKMIVKMGGLYILARSVSDVTRHISMYGPDII